jgi:hypothetical protein
MKGIRSLVACGVLVAAGSVLPASAQQPAYLVLPPSPNTGIAIPSHTPRYAYGWFGVAPRYHWSRQFGYYRSYTQWKAK